MAVTTGQVNALYQELLGRSGAEQYLSDWASSGMTIDQIRTAIANTPEGQAYSASQAEGIGTGTGTGTETDTTSTPTDTTTTDTTTTDTTAGASDAVITTSYTDPGTTTNVFGQTTVGSNDLIQGTIEVLFERYFGRPPTSEEADVYGSVQPKR